MKNLFKIIMAVAFAVLLGQYAYSAGNGSDESPAAKVLESGRKTKRLEGSSLKIARPILKKTPISAIMDNIEMLMICPLDSKDSDDLTARAEKMLKRYMLVREIDDELSHMFIYIDTPQKDRFTELILYTKSPDTKIMLFEGDFTVEDLMKVGELSVQDRKQRIRDRR